MPHSEIHGSKVARTSPRLIATCYVLHRLSVPRHPPNALIALDPKHCIALAIQRLGTLSISVISSDQLQADCLRYQARLSGTKALATHTAISRDARGSRTPRQRSDSSAQCHGKTPVAGQLHPINNVKQHSREIALSAEPVMRASRFQRSRKLGGPGKI